MKVKTMNDLSVIATDAAKAVEALPIITNAISQMQTDLTPAQHAGVVSAAADALVVAAQSAQALGAQGLIGHNDANDVQEGAAIMASGIGIAGEVEALALKLRALVRHLL